MANTKPTLNSSTRGGLAVLIQLANAAHDRSLDIDFPVRVCKERARAEPGRPANVKAAAEFLVKLAKWYELQTEEV